MTAPTGRRPIVCGLDPAASGNTAIIVAALDPETGARWVLDGWNQPNAQAGDVLNKMKSFTEIYQPHEWIIERNAFQRFLAQLPEIVQFMRARGVKITPHYTTTNKFDEDWGIETMAPLFDSCIIPDAKNPEVNRPAPFEHKLMHLPSQRQNSWVNDLVQQLTTWQPSGMAQHAKTDLVMALWFTHIAFTAQMNRRKTRQTHYQTPFMSPRALKSQTTINLRAMREQKREEQLARG